MKKRTPYTYLIGWAKLDRWYYGRRSRSGCHPDEFWSKYFTSSKVVKKFRKEHGEPDVIQIRKVFKDDDSFKEALKCRRWEITALRRLRVRHDNRWLNRCVTKCDTTGYVSVKSLQTGETYLTEIDDPAYCNKEVVHVATGVSKGMMAAVDINGNNVRVSVDDPRRRSGDIKGVNSGKSNYYDQFGNIIQASVNHPSVLSGEFSSIFKDTVPARCAKTGASLGRISINDERISNGQALLSNKGIERTYRKVACQHCGRLIATNNHGRHEQYCDKNPNAIPNPRIGEKHKSVKKACRYCGRQMGAHVLSVHEEKCQSNPFRQLTYAEKHKLSKGDKSERRS
jgi:hypothetical protein